MSSSQIKDTCSNKSTASRTVRVSATYTPSSGVPNAGTPIKGTPSGCVQNTGTPTKGTPSGGVPTTGTPTIGTPNRGVPSSGTPTHGANSSGNTGSHYRHPSQYNDWNKTGSAADCPLSPSSFHRPWAMPESPKAKPVQPTPITPTKSPLGSPLGSPLPPHYSRSPQPFLLNPTARPDPGIPLSPFPYPELSSPPPVSAMQVHYPPPIPRDFGPPPCPPSPFPAGHAAPSPFHPHPFPGSPSHMAASRMISLVDPLAPPGGTPTYVNITHEQRLTDNLSVVTVDQLQNMQNLHHLQNVQRVRDYHHTFKPHFHPPR